MTKNDVINSLIKEIDNSGKKLKDIPMSSIVAYISNCGMKDKKTSDYIIDAVYNYYNMTKKVSDVNVKEEYVKMENINSSNNEIKQRTPRKSIFSEIKKI